MLRRIADWLGFGGEHQGHGPGDHHHGQGSKGHTHGIVDPTLATTTTGIWAIKWSFVILAVTAALQLVVVFASGSVALLADTIHNIGDATTAIPLWIAFVLVRRKPSRTFTYGLGRVEDLAGLAIVLIILASAIVAGYEAIDRLFHPQAISQIGWVAIAGVIGFAGNEAVAVFRIRVGREINSAALIADGYHARTDGLTSLAVVLGAAGVWFGFPLADPIIGLLITIAILGIVWQSARAVLTRMLDGVEPDVLAEIEHAGSHVSGVDRIVDVKARWLGHRLHADVTIAVDEDVLFAVANQISAAFQEELFDHLPALASANVRLVSTADRSGASYHHTPAPFRVMSNLADGLLEIADTPAGERMVLRVARHAEGLRARVAIQRDARIEEIDLTPSHGNHHRLESREAPAEPHEFAATLLLTAGEAKEELSFRMIEPAEHVH
jgi:cation diffusion facilitator family transporter